MKKRFSLIMVLALFTLFTFGVARADSILDFLKLAEAQDDTFGYSSDDKLIIKDITNSNIDIESPIIKKWSRDVTAYLFNVSTSRANSAPVAYWCIYNLNDVTVNWNKFSVSLRTSSLDRDETYYIYAIPVDWSVANGTNGLCTSNEAKDLLDSWILWRESITNGEDPCFKIDGWIYWEWSYCENHSSGNRWWDNSNGVGVYAIRNISHTYDGKNIKLTWESLGADVNVEIFLWYEDDNTFKKIWDVNSEKKAFTFKAVHSGDHIVKLKPADNYQEINYTAHYLETVSPQVEPVTPSTPVKPVVVWPKENIMLVIFGTLILYVVYRIAKRKA